MDTYVEAKIIHQMLLPQYDKAVCISSIPSREAYVERDRHLVSFTAHCIAYCTRHSRGRDCMYCAPCQLLRMYCL